MDVAEKLHMTDLNLVVLKGKLAAKPLLFETGHGSEYIRYLVTVRSEAPRRRVDVVPVIYWNPGHGQVLRDAERGSGIYVTGQMQHRFMTEGQERVSRLEVHATSVVIEENEEEQT